MDMPFSNNETTGVKKVNLQLVLLLSLIVVFILLVVGLYFIIEKKLNKLEGKVTNQVEVINNQITTAPEKLKQNVSEKFDIGQDLPVTFDYPVTYSQRVASDHKNVDFWRGEKMMFTVKHMPKDKIALMLEDKRMSKEIIGKVGPDECIDIYCGTFDAYLYREEEVNCGQMNCPIDHRVYLVDNTEGVVFIFYNEYDISLSIREIVTSVKFIR